MKAGTPSARWPERSAKERFLEKTCPEPNSGCLLWTGAIKVLDIRKMAALGFLPTIGLQEGLERTYREYVEEQS